MIFTLTLIGGCNLLHFPVTPMLCCRDECFTPKAVLNVSKNLPGGEMIKIKIG